MSTVLSSILTEVGTNELEVVEFAIEDRPYAINVAKVREIVRYQKPMPVPHAHPCMLGVFRNRDEVIPLVDLGRWIGSGVEPDPRVSKIIVSEFNKMKIGFLVHRVERIHRTHWGALETPEGVALAESPATLGLLRLGAEGERIVFMLDFERIVAEMEPDHPDEGPREARPADERRRGKVVLVAEDSGMVRNLMRRKLEAGGYTVVAVGDGQAAWEALESGTKVHLLITDIEMPRMDGHHLLHRVRTDERLKSLPVILYSSMIHEEMRRKGESLGATAQICKPELVELLDTVDRVVLGDG